MRPGVRRYQVAGDSAPGKRGIPRTRAPPASRAPIRAISPDAYPARHRAECPRCSGPNVRSPEVDLQRLAAAPRRNIPQDLAMISIVGGAALEQVVNFGDAEGLLRGCRRVQIACIRENAHSRHDRIPRKYRITPPPRPPS